MQTLEQPDGLFDVIVIDPPWGYIKYGEVNDDYAIFAKSINQFEKKFIEFVGNRIADGKPCPDDFGFLR